MNIFTENQFTNLPEAEIRRSRFDTSYGHTTTANAGRLIPFHVEEILPGDTFTVDTSIVARMTTPITPTMGNANLDYYYFFVPNRLVWEHWQEFCGENNSTYWTQPTEYNIPKIVNTSENKFTENSVADYFGLPINETGKFEVNALPFRAYVKIFNDWFRDENVQPPAYFYKGDNNILAKPSTDNGNILTIDQFNEALYGGACLPVNKYHDYFTSMLPGPQKSTDPVTIPLFEDIPVITKQINISENSATNSYPMRWSKIGSETTNISEILDSYGKQIPIRIQNQTTQSENTDYNTVIDQTATPATSGKLLDVAPINLWASVGDTPIVTINQLRTAFQIQKFYEKEARAGTRYTEILSSMFGVKSADGRLQRAEYLGGQRIPINIDQVIQTSATTDTPQGNTAAYSLSTRVDNTFTHSFTEHGYVIGVAAIRTEQVYQNNISRMWNRTTKFDYYWPVLSNIGEQSVLSQELQYSSDYSIKQNNSPIGFQEAWAEYRYHNNMVTGKMRHNATGTLDSWHYANWFEMDETTTNVVSSDFIVETKANIDRTIAVPSEPEFLIDIYIKQIATRPMPLYSIPGYVDHF